MFWLKIVGTLFKTLKEGATPAQIALGFVLGWAIGLIPGWPLQVWVLILLLLVLRANLGIALAAWLLAAGVGWIFDPLLHRLGAMVLRNEALHDTFTVMYNTPPWALTRFNNTVVMGTFVASIACAVLFFPLLVWGVKWYRGVLLERMMKLKIVQAILGSRIYRWYVRLEEMGLV